jgi:hypothetical protein
LLAFAGTRTQHRMAVRIEDAGFEIRDMLAWVYGSGFPKSLDVSKALDKMDGKTLHPCLVKTKYLVYPIARSFKQVLTYGPMGPVRAALPVSAVLPTPTIM